MQHDSADDRISPPTSDHDSIRLLIAGYAIGITTAEESARVRAALVQQPDLHAEALDYQQVVKSILISTPPLAPPPHALDALLRATAPVTIVPREAAALRLWKRAALLVASLAVVLAGVSAYFASQVAALQSERALLLHNLEDQTVALDLMSAQDVRWVKMQHRESQEQNDPYAWLVYSPGMQSGVILANQFPQNANTRDYKVWVSRGQEPLWVGDFEVDEYGAGAYSFSLPDEIAAFDQLYISPDDPAGSPDVPPPSVVRLDIQERFNG